MLIITLYYMTNNKPKNSIKKLVMEEEDTININKQSEAVNSKLLQSRPVMFSGDIKDFLLYKRHLLILLSGCNLLEELKPKEERNKKYKSTATARTRTITICDFFYNPTDYY